MQNEDEGVKGFFGSLRHIKGQYKAINRKIHDREL